MAVAQKSKQPSRSLAAQTVKRGPKANAHKAKANVLKAGTSKGVNATGPKVTGAKVTRGAVAKPAKAKPTAGAASKVVPEAAPLLAKAKAALKKENKTALRTPPVKPKAPEFPTVVTTSPIPAPAAKSTGKVAKGREIKVKPTSDEKKANRAEARAKSRKISIEASANEAASALLAKWNLLFKKADQIDQQPYNMKGVFEEKTAIVHKLLGWGYILANRNDRLEVLFKDGIKYLISNYQP